MPSERKRRALTGQAEVANLEDTEDRCGGSRPSIGRLWWQRCEHGREPGNVVPLAEQCEVQRVAQASDEETACAQTAVDALRKGNLCNYLFVARSAVVHNSACSWTQVNQHYGLSLCPSPRQHHISHNEPCMESVVPSGLYLKASQSLNLTNWLNLQV